ncbi:hypothetical protein [Nocardioides sp. Iso805N]|uniref:hypothetical protein n=1 Tax=Nocardioides sp. Iso805N TaxID=1283287 RepID=UPI00036C436F|nr:hypothetical protein [Nocardioides sp. Iso805N]
MTPPTPALSRRATLGLAAAPLALFLTGCSGGEAKDRLDATADRLQAPRSTPPAPANPDQPLVDEVVTAIADLRATLLPHRSEASVIDDLVRLHASHLRSLDAASAPGTPATLGSGAVLEQIDSRERALSSLLATKASTAHDGGLARLLGSMSAAIAQRTTGGLA